VEVGDAVQPPPLDAGHLSDRESRAREPAVDQGLDLEPVPPQHRRARRRHEGVVREVEERDQVGPERVVAVAEVGEAGAEGDVHPGVQEPVAKTAHRGDVGAATAGPEPRPLGEVGPSDQGLDEPRDLLGVGRTVRVEHHDHVAGDPREAGCEGVALAPPRLADRHDAREDLLRGVHGPVDRSAVDQDDLVHRREPREHLAQVRGLVESRHDHADPWLTGSRERRRNGRRDLGRPAGHLSNPPARPGSAPPPPRGETPQSPVNLTGRYPARPDRMRAGSTRPAQRVSRGSSATATKSSER
jgi:hypothetical protein